MYHLSHVCDRKILLKAQHQHASFIVVGSDPLAQSCAKMRGSQWLLVWWWSTVAGNSHPDCGESPCPRSADLMDTQMSQWRLS
ncbi:hypothetical protein EYF80_008034 [Liparis tanakae]|uniref:Uncharacterized protein n=1 Tax=Liparis tanakae TaxID=230148 RepID=A0A4Z2IVP9_9TELE|nr:hypothetical protein EYF80_008034 [Liparis tanakae]